MPNFSQNIGVGTFWKRKADRLALKLDGANDYVQILNYNQFERTQPFTLFLRANFLAKLANGQTATVFATNNTFFGAGLFVFFSEFTGVGAFIQLALSLNTSQRVRVRFDVDSIINTDAVIQITYEGDSDANNINCYIDGVLQTKDVLNNNLASSILNARTTAEINQLFTSSPANFILNELSFVDFSKNATEIANDFNAGKQSTGTGQFLLNVKPIYKQQIKTLETGKINSDLIINQAFWAIEDSPNAYRYKLFGYPDPLVLPPTVPNNFELIT